MIYFIRDTASGFVKIGYSENPWLRMCKMQSDCPGELSLVGVLDGDQARESEIHRDCAAQRVRGEWFRDEGRVSAYVAGAQALLKPESAKSRRVALLIALCETTGQAGNTVNGWLKRGRVPPRWMAAVARSGVLTAEQMCAAASANAKRNRGAGPLVVRLEEVAA